MSILKFGKGNGKMIKLALYLGIPKAQILTFDIPAGFSCAKANICKSFANRKTGKIRQLGSVLCYASKGERYLPNVRKARWHNYDILLACGKNTTEIFNLLSDGINKSTKIVRIHSSGDFYSIEYFNAWIKVAQKFPNIKFFAYTKHLDYAMTKVSSNFKIQYSYGGLDDSRYKDFISKGFVIPTCFIGEYEGQYPHKVVCGKGGEHEDFFAIQKGEDFVIDAH